MYVGNLPSFIPFTVGDRTRYTIPDGLREIQGARDVNELNKSHLKATRLNHVASSSLPPASDVLRPVPY